MLTMLMFGLFFQLLLFGLLVKVTDGAKRFIIRLDDTEHYNHSNVQADLMNYFMDNNVPVSAGIIGKFFTGADLTIYNPLKRCV